MFGSGSSCGLPVLLADVHCKTLLKKMADTRESQKRKGRPRLSLSEKKRRKTFRETERDLSRIRLGDQFVRWRVLMEELGLASDTEMAKFLLDSYEVTKNVANDEPKHAESLASTSSCFTSTPGQVLLRHTERMKTPSVSKVSAIESGRLPMVKKIMNHFWFSCKTASSYEQFLSIWRSVLHHITNNMSGSSHMAMALINAYMNLCQRMKRGQNLGLIPRRMPKS